MVTLEERVDRLESEQQVTGQDILAVLDKLATKEQMDAGFREVNERLDKLETQVKLLTHEVQAHGGNIDNIKRREATLYTT